jgi:hypothetical protein
MDVGRDLECVRLVFEWLVEEVEEARAAWLQSRAAATLCVPLREGVDLHIAKMTQVRAVWSIPLIAPTVTQRYYCGAGDSATAACSGLGS